MNLLKPFFIFRVPQKNNPKTIVPVYYIYDIYIYICISSYIPHQQLVTTLEVNSQLRVGPTAPPQDRDAVDCGRAAVVWGGVSPAARGNDATLRTKCRETAGNVRENG